MSISPYLQVIGFAIIGDNPLTQTVYFDLHPIRTIIRIICCKDFFAKHQIELQAGRSFNYRRYNSYKKLYVNASSFINVWRPEIRTNGMDHPLNLQTLPWTGKQNQAICLDKTHETKESVPSVTTWYLRLKG